MKLIKEELLMEMSNLLPRRTGLPYSVWVDDAGMDREVSHNILRLKYGPSYDDCVTIPFFDKKDLYEAVGELKKGKLNMKQISKWINLNYTNLIEFYTNADYDFKDFIDNMKTI